MPFPNLSGMKKMNAFPPERLIDIHWYAAQTGESFSDHKSAYEHFRAHGQPSGLNPSPFFYTAWYIWQNPDVSGYATVLDHFVRRGADAIVDPAPFLDGITFLGQSTKYANIIQALAALTKGEDTSLSPRLDDHLALLAARQAEVHQAVRAHYICRRPSGRRRLVWIQAGPRFNATRWFRPASPRRWDLMCNWYTRDGLDLRHGEIHLSQAGTKPTAIHHVLRNDPDLFRGYDQILFLDDDLFIAHEDIDRLFDIAQSDGLELFQAALLPGSHGVWTDLFQKSSKGSRRTTGVEIMMPGFTRAALFSCTELFGRNISGYGLDFMFSEHIRRAGGGCGVVDAVGVRHEAPIDERGGAYYRQMRALGINYKLELYAAIHELGKFPTFKDSSAGAI